MVKEIAIGGGGLVREKLAELKAEARNRIAGFPYHQVSSSDFVPKATSQFMTEPPTAHIDDWTLYGREEIQQQVGTIPGEPMEYVRRPVFTFAVPISGCVSWLEYRPERTPHSLSPKVIVNSGVIKFSVKALDLNKSQVEAERDEMLSRIGEWVTAIANEVAPYNTELSAIVAEAGAARMAALEASDMLFGALRNPNQPEL